MRQFKILGDFIVRTPSLPFSFVTHLLDNNYSSEEIFGFLDNPKIREAVYMASPSLLSQIEEYPVGSEKRNDTAWALVKYLIRMSTRATPFGLFAGVFTSTFDNATKVKIDLKTPTRRTRLSFDILAILHDFLIAEINIKSNLAYHVNTSLYPIGSDYRYIKEKLQTKGKQYAIEQLKSSNCLIDSLSLFKDGSSIDQSHKAMISMGYDKVASLEYLEDLIKQKIIVPETKPYTVGASYLVRLTKILEEKSSPNNRILFEINAIKAKISELDGNETNSIEEYEYIRQKLVGLINTNAPDLLQVDLFVNKIESTIDFKEKKILYQGLRVLSKISNRNSPSQLEEFKNKFLERYAGNPSKLVEVLDFDSGLGYPLNNRKSEYWYLSGLDICAERKGQNQSEPSEFERLLNYKLVCLSNAKKVEITNKDLNSIHDFELNTPATFYALVERYVLDGQTFYFMPAISGPSAGSLIGRFSGHNKEIDSIMEHIAQIEQEFHKDAICVEIDHIPEEKIGNVLFRSNFRNHVIPFLSGKENSSVDYISINDIYLSVSNGNLILTLGLNGKKMVPYLSNAHNYRKSMLPIYLFLCDFQFVNSESSISFSWGNLAKTRVFLPRVIYQNVILSKSRWILSKSILNKHFDHSINNDSGMLAFESFTKTWEIPRYVNLVQGDNLLFLDFNSQISIEIFLNEQKNQDLIILEEFIIADEPLIINENGDGHLNELIFNFKTLV